MTLPRPRYNPNSPPQDPSNPNPTIPGGVSLATHQDPLNVDESDCNYILRTTLKPIHQTDPNVLKFISAYLNVRDTKEAAKQIGLNAYEGRHLFDRVDIQAAIRKITNLAVEKYGYDAESVLERTKEIANLDPADAFNPDGTFKKNINDIPLHARRAIKKIKVKNIIEKDPNGMDVVVGHLGEFEFYDKVRTLELMGREKEIFKEKKVHEHEVSKNMRDLLLASKQRAEQGLIDVTPRQGETPRGITTQEQSAVVAAEVTTSEGGGHQIIKTSGERVYSSSLLIDEDEYDEDC